MSLRFTTLFTVFLCIFICGCNDDDSPTETDYVEEYTGVYMWRDVTRVMDEAKIDSVDFTITNSISYEMRFREVNSNDQLVDFCDHDGRLDEYTSNIMDFDPLIFVSENCDTLRVPRGEFTADYRSHMPDTIYIEKRIADSLWQLVVLPK